MQISTLGSRQAGKQGKGNHRRTYRAGMPDMWGYREYLYNSFIKLKRRYYLWCWQRPYVMAYGFVFPET